MARWSSWPTAVFAFASLAGVGLSYAVASGRPALGGRWSLTILLALWAVAWLAAVLAALRLPGRPAVAMIVVAGVAIRLASLAGPPATSDDLYRYAWDGRVQAAGVDPYAQPPAAPQLARLRERWLWPDPAGCAGLSRPPGCTRLNRPPVRTIYPPVAEAWFAAVYRVGGVAARHKAWQVAGLVTELATLGLLVAGLARSRRDPRWVALYALCPAAVLEIGNNGHVDGLAIAFIVAALAVRSVDTAEAAPPTASCARSMARRDAAAAALITLAALVKLYPAVLLLPLIACRPGRRLPALLRVGAVASGLTVLAYATHVAAVGGKVLGYLPGYLKEENYQGGGRYLIASVLHLPHGWAGLVTLLGVGAVAGWIVKWRPSLPAASAALVGAVLLAASPAQPWYAVSLLALATVAARPAWTAVVVAGYAASLASVLDRRDSGRIGGWAYLAALVVVLLGAAVRPLVSRQREGRP